jgi:hypothetical protein
MWWILGGVLVYAVVIILVLGCCKVAGETDEEAQRHYRRLVEE